MELPHPTTLPYKCDDFPVPIVVRNTFINAVIERSPSLEQFVRERRSSSCPLSGGTAPFADAHGSASPQTVPAARQHYGSAPVERLAAAAASLTVARGGSENTTAQAVAGPAAPAPRPPPPPPPPPPGASAAARAVCAPVGLVIPKQPLRQPARFPGAAVAGGSNAGAGGGASGVLGRRVEPRSATTLEVWARKEPTTLAAATAENPRLLAPKCPLQEAKDTLDLDLPSVGSAGHRQGRCRPCVFVHKKGCSNGTECPFCHICQPGEKQRRKRDRWEKIRDRWSSNHTGWSTWEETDI